MKNGKSRLRLPHPYLIRANSRIPNSLVDQALVKVAAFLECKKYGNEFFWLCRTIEVEGKVDVSFEATQMAIRRHEEAGRVRLLKSTKTERKFCEQAESYYDEEIDTYYVVPNDSLFKWWEEQESGDTTKTVTKSGEQPVDWDDYRNGPNGPLLTVVVCKELLNVSGKELSLHEKAKETRKKNPAGRGFVYRYDVVSLISNRKSDND